MVLRGVSWGAYGGTLAAVGLEADMEPLEGVGQQANGGSLEAVSMRAD